MVLNQYTYIYIYQPWDVTGLGTSAHYITYLFDVEKNKHYINHDKLCHELVNNI